MTEGRKTKTALVAKAADAAGLPKTQVATIVDTVLAGIADALGRGEKVEFRGFGSFRVRQRGPRQVRSPRTGERMEVPARRVPHFKPGRKLNELVNR